MWLTGFRSQDTYRRTFVAQGSGLTRGDRNRNERIAALRQVVRRDRAVLAIDLGEDKQAAALVDHEGRVLARRIVKAKAYQLGSLLAWAADKAVAAGFAGLTVACEPTGHRWKALMGLADAGGHGFVCVQSLAVARAREGDDYTRDKTDLLTELPVAVSQVSGQAAMWLATVARHDHRRRCTAGLVPACGAAARVA